MEATAGAAFSVRFAFLLVSPCSSNYAYDMEESAELPEEKPANLCGQCGLPIDPGGAAPNHCPHCGTQLVSPGTDSSEELAAEEGSDELEDELSALRIRQISAMRRAADRARSYCLIGLIVLVVGAGQLLSITFHDMREFGWHLPEFAYAGGALAALFFAWRLWQRVVALTCELKQPLQTDPLQPPDFSTLNDGSQHIKHLEEM